MRVATRLNQEVGAQYGFLHKEIVSFLFACGVAGALLTTRHRQESAG
ncbi:MAG: hypothetical protein IRZ15_13030 [Bryobacteraceae bacterium]|nr:hypothetical protein [Bryobacteraceae bacterium]